MIRFADKADIDNIKKLWDIVFPEEPEFNEYFFDNIFDYKNTLVMTNNKELLAMVQMIPYEIKGLGKTTYIYGAATNPKYRKKGFMSELLKQSFKIDAYNGVSSSILIPANRPLFEFYKRFGYETVFYVNKYIHSFYNKTADIKEADYGDIDALMDIYSGDIIRSLEYWKIQIDMYKKLGGKVFIYNTSYAVVSDKVEEIMYSKKEDKDILLNSICKYLKCGEVEVLEKGSDIPMGMLKKHNEFNIDKLYMNLMYN